MWQRVSARRHAFLDDGERLVADSDGSGARLGQRVSADGETEGARTRAVAARRDHNPRDVGAGVARTISRDATECDGAGDAACRCIETAGRQAEAAAQAGLIDGEPNAGDGKCRRA